MNNLRQAIENAERELPEGGNPEMLRDSLREVIQALKIIEEELQYKVNKATEED